MASESCSSLIFIEYEYYNYVLAVQENLPLALLVFSSPFHAEAFNLLFQSKDPNVHKQWAGDSHQEFLKSCIKPGHFINSKRRNLSLQACTVRTRTISWSTGGLDICYVKHPASQSYHLNFGYIWLITWSNTTWRPCSCQPFSSTPGRQSTILLM